MKKVLLVVLIITLNSSAWSQTEESEWDYYMFEDIGMSFLTTKRPEKTSETAMNIRVITRDDIENYGFQSLRELFGFISNSIQAVKGVDNVYGLRGIIGYANDKVKFLIDGFEFPMQLGLGEGAFPITLDEVKRIEIVKGPNTSIWGGNATQATINIIRFNGSDFQGLRIGAAAGSFGNARGWVHYAEQPNADLNYDIYFNTAYSEGYDHPTHQWWHGGTTENPDFADGIRNGDWENQVRNTPLPDHELISAVNYKDFRMMYRRVEQGMWLFNRFVRNYTDAAALEAKFPEILGQNNMDFIMDVEVSAFGQQYDVYHPGNRNDWSNENIEHKAEKRLEWNAYIHTLAEGEWDLLAGLSGNFWRAESTEWGGYLLERTGPFPGFVYAPNIRSGVVTDEFFPSFAEVNDLANFELWADWKFTGIEDFSFVLGGRYVYDFEPDDQLRTDDSPSALYRTDREFLRDFFPKAAVVWNADENKTVKLIYQEGFNRPNTFEQFSMQKNIGNRGRSRATKAETIELVFDWYVSENVKTQLAAFDTEITDFMNFIYTGATNFPNIEPGDLIGFYNVGDQSIQGIEFNLDVRYEKYGGMFSFGHLMENEIKPFDRLHPDNAGSGGTGATGMIDDSDFNKQTVPEWTVSLGLWVKPWEKVTLSLLYKIQGDIKNNFHRDNYGLNIQNKNITELDVENLDLILNIKDCLVENLNLQFLIQNATDELNLLGSALDPVTSHAGIPVYYQGKVSYLWS